MIHNNKTRQPFKKIWLAIACIIAFNSSPVSAVFGSGTDLKSKKEEAIEQVYKHIETLEETIDDHIIAVFLENDESCEEFREMRLSIAKSVRDTMYEIGGKGRYDIEKARTNKAIEKALLHAKKDITKAKIGEFCKVIQTIIPYFEEQYGLSKIDQKQLSQLIQAEQQKAEKAIEQTKKLKTFNKEQDRILLELVRMQARKIYKYPLEAAAQREKENFTGWTDGEKQAAEQAIDHEIAAYRNKIDTAPLDNFPTINKIDLLQKSLS